MSEQLNDAPLTQETIQTDLRSMFRAAIHQTLTIMLADEIQQQVGRRPAHGQRTAGGAERQLS